MSKDKKNVVVVGGGNGSATSIRALKAYKDDFNISTVVSTSDSGGSSGRLRKEFNTLPTGDILRAVLALSSQDYRTLKHIFYGKRFDGVGKLDKHNLGNLFLVFAEQYDGSFMHALRALEQSLDAVGHAHPMTLEQSDLCVEMTDGTIVCGEHEIDRPTDGGSSRIKRAWLDPEPTLYPEAKKAIEEADYIIFGPGSLYCSIIPNLLVKGMQEAIEKSNAILGYIAGNAYETKGERGPETLCEFIDALEEYLPRQLDCTVYNNHVLSESDIKKYKQKEWTPIIYDEDACKKHKIIQGDYEKTYGGLDIDRLGALFQDCIE